MKQHNKANKAYLHQGRRLHWRCLNWTNQGHGLIW